MNYKNLDRRGVTLSKEQLENYLEKMASDHILKNSSNKDTYPILKVKENFEIIQEVYNLLNEHIKLGITIHPAGEWLLDNFYIIDETVKTIIKQMPLSKYTKFLGISNGIDRGFARVYVLAYEIISHTDNRVDYNNISSFLSAYQQKKTLSMDEIWNIGLFMQIAIIQNIKDVCEKIYFSQMQKYRVENIIERLVENKQEQKYKNLKEYKNRVKGYGEMKYPFIEYMLYKLKKQGKYGYKFIDALEEQVNKMGTNIDEVIKKEHFDMSLKKVSMSNCIISMKELLRIDFLEIFEKTNEVEEILKKDPAKVYSIMDNKTKEYYRNKIQEIATKTKVSEIYVTRKILELAQKEENISQTKKTHIGYYLIDKGIDELYKTIQPNSKQKLSKNTKEKIYVLGIWGITILLDTTICTIIKNHINNIIINIILFILLLIPLQEIIIQIIQYILGKIVKPKIIPKIDMNKGIPKDCATFVVIPTIIKSKEKVKELMRKLEVYYLANKSDNIYFALLGDCSSGKNKEEQFDEEVIKEGINQVEKLNKKYKNQENEIPIFSFLYRKRFWNGKEECYLGWERKRGLLNQFNEYLLGNEENVFRVNTLEDCKKNLKEKMSDLETSLNRTKYVITLDSDTNLTLNTGFELIGAMTHILNTPILNKNRNIVIDGHALIQPRVRIDLETSRKNLFTKIFAGNGGVDSYTNAISDVYQDNFGEGIFTGKGIYDLKIFSEVLNNEIPEDTVLSHDLLEGSYLRCGLASDIMLMDGYPSNYNSFKTRLHRWIRGDIQIIQWLGRYITTRKSEQRKNPLNFLSKYKIFDNIIRAILPVMTLLSIIYVIIISIIFKSNLIFPISIILISIIMPTILDVVDKIIYRKEGEKNKKTFEKNISSLYATVIRGIINLGVLPDKAYLSLNAIIKTIYRLNVKKHLLEWTTSEEAEKMSKTDLLSYYISMLPNLVLGILGTIYSIMFTNILILILSILWIAIPSVLWYISKNIKEQEKIEQVKKEDKEYILDIGLKTWKFFKDSLTKENNYIPPDNYQEDRITKFVPRTSSTNIGLGLLSVISSYDLGYENLKDTIILLNKMIITIERLQKWHGHLYNWYNIETLEPLYPRYISTVDSGNFIGYIYVLKQFYLNVQENIKQILNETKQVREKDKLQIDLEKMKKEELEEILNLIPFWVDKPINEINIANADFSKLYDNEKRLFSIGFNVEENKLTDSYYDLLASEARQASLVAIAKKDISAKHWYNLGRTLTTLNGYKGLVSWSGTAFEYLMPNVNIKKYKGSILDESCKFMITSQKQYANKLDVPWGFSEAAFNIKDLNNNYQYKAIGIPWLGLKRGLENDIVISTYGSVLAITEEPNEIIENLKILEKQGMYGKYGFYESIDYTPIRLKKGKKSEVVKTYMAHHQALILLSINNVFNRNILQERFHNNPEIEAVDILLQEKMPEDLIITKEEKIKPKKIEYIDYESSCYRVFNKINENLKSINVISNEDYTIVMDIKGRGYSKYKDILVNRYKETSDETQGIFFYIKNIKNKRIWTSNYMNYLAKPDKYEITFSEDSDKIKRIDGAIETTTKTTVSAEETVEIRRIELNNNGIEEEMLEITSVIEPVLSSGATDYSHPAFNNLFLIFEYIQEKNIFIVKRKARKKEEPDIYMGVTIVADEYIGELEYEIDKEKFVGRGNLGLPTMVETSKPFSKKIQLVTDPILAIKGTIRIKPEEKKSINLVISVSENKEEVIRNVEKYKNKENIDRAFELSLARVDTEARYLELNGKNIETYQRMLGYLIYQNPLKKNYIKNIEKNIYPQSELWKYGISGDLPILLIEIKQLNDKYVLDEVLKAYEFFKLKNIKIDLVILNEEINSYENYVREEIQNSILNNNLIYSQNISGGIYVIENCENSELLKFKANLIIDTTKGNIERQLNDLEEEYLENIKQIGEEPQKIYYEEEKNSKPLDYEELNYYNEYGGFSKDGKEYLIRVNKNDRLPTVWSNILANEKFGTVVTESMGGFTWNKNSRLNRLTSWSNNQVIDNPSEIIYMQDEETMKTCSLGLNPMPDNNDYYITYGFGYSKYTHTSSNIVQELDVFVPKADSTKISILKLKNLEPKKKKLKFVYYIKPVLGEEELLSNGMIDIEYNQNLNMVLLKNLSNEIFNNYTFVCCSENIKSFTGEKSFFVGNGNLSNPEALKKVALNNENGLGQDTILAIQINVELEAFETKEISFILGSGDNIISCQDNAYKYSKIQNCIDSYSEIKNYWNLLLNKVQVDTPLESFNILLNGWIMYGSITSRLWAKSAFYQSGGAFGFRDQLQDTIGMKYFDKEIMKNQIIKHSKHQFIEGDVEHWWHDETSRGIRTRFSDDLLWLVYLVEEYINFTGDYKILEIQTPYKKGETLEEGIDEKYDIYSETEEVEEIYKHCNKAIEKSLNFGENNLPKIGSGDWNDGFSEVGNKGKGESIWLGFFMYDILQKWIPIIKTRIEILERENKQQEKEIEEKRIEKYNEILNILKKSLNTNGWDGRWYKRAFTDDGDTLGTIQNEECRIDSIAQSWSVISNAGDNDKKYISMESLENHLVDRENGIIKLLDPPFDKSKLEPGYIKAYLPGTRENGGQYTHAAIWAIIAETMLGFGDKALELYRMINPIEHSRTKEAANKYKVEPYAIAADIYGSSNLAGRGGWTWYTGSSSWMYEAGIKYILGLNIEKGILKIKPCIPKDWKEYSIRYRYENSIYNIKIKNTEQKNTGISKLILNGQEIEEKEVRLQENGIYDVEIIM